MEHIVTYEGLGPCPYQVGDRIVEPVMGVAKKIKTYEFGAGGVGTYEVEILVDEMSDKPTTQDLILLEVRDLTASLGELRMQLNGVWQRVVALEGRVRTLESGPTISLGVGGELVEEGEFTVTPPEWVT